MKRMFLVLSVFVVVMLALNGAAYSIWCDNVIFAGEITTMRGSACIKIQKTLDGAYTDPWTGADLAARTNLILIGYHPALTAITGGIDCPPPPPPPVQHPTKFLMYINVTNCGGVELTDVVVTDRLENQFAPLNWTTFPTPTGSVTWVNVTHGGSGFNHSYLTWNIGTLSPGQNVSIVIWIWTTQNPGKDNKYEPTEPCTCYEVNRGAQVYADSIFGELQATTSHIVLYINGYVYPDAKIAKITTVLPFHTAWNTTSIS